MSSMDLYRGNMLQVAPISCKNTLKLLPLGKNNRQKLVVGDDSGTVHCYDFREGEPVSVFISTIFAGPVSCVALGGPLHGKRDRIYASHQQEILGVSKKGKEFFRLSSSLTENINTIHVEDTIMWTSCEYILNTYDDGKDQSFYMSRDYVKCMVVEYLLRESNASAVLGCQDNLIRVVDGTEVSVAIETNAPVTSLHAVAKSNTESKPPILLYALEDGSISLLRFSMVDPASRIKRAYENDNLDDEANQKGYVKVWTVPDSKVNKSPVSCMTVAQLGPEGTSMSVVVGREDGRVEVFNQKVPEGMTSGLHRIKPSLAFSCDLGEQIQSIACGLINSDVYKELVVATFSGKLVSFTTEMMQSRASPSQSKTKANVANENRLRFLEKEVAALKEKIKSVKSTINKLEESGSSTKTTAGKSKSGLATRYAQDFSSNVKYTLEQELGYYVLSVEIQCNLDLVILRSTVDLSIPETDLTTCVVSETPAHLLEALHDDETPMSFVAAVRCLQGEKRVKIALQHREGDYGDLTVTVVTDMRPKAAKSFVFPIKPLALHARKHTVNEEESARPRCMIQFQGNFSMGVALEWLHNLVSDVPPHIEETKTREEFYFHSALGGAIAVCRLRKNEIVFESQSASAIAVFKEGITRQANYRRVHLQESSVMNKESVSVYLGIFKQKLMYQLNLARRNEFSTAIKEVVVAELGNDSLRAKWLPEEYYEIARDADKIKAEFQGRAKALQFLCTLITNLFMDWHRLQGITPKTSVADMWQVLYRADIPGLVTLFEVTQDYD